LVRLTGKDKELQIESKRELNKIELSSYPNPFNPMTKITFNLPENNIVSLSIYNSLGEEIKRIVDRKELVKGVYTFNWNASNYSSGVYFYVLQAGMYIETKKIILMK
ncbi:T9SS type A sorting domain-containing protein, partial [Bacteroidota bacterium]